MQGKINYTCCHLHDVLLSLMKCHSWQMRSNGQHESLEVSPNVYKQPWPGSELEEHLKIDR